MCQLLLGNQGEHCHSSLKVSRKWKLKEKAMVAFPVEHWLLFFDLRSSLWYLSYGGVYVLFLHGCLVEIC